MRAPPHRETGLVHALADGELGPLDASQVRSHLARCPSCARELGDALLLGELGERLASVEGSLPWCWTAKSPRS